MIVQQTLNPVTEVTYWDYSFPSRSELGMAYLGGYMSYKERVYPWHF